MLKLNPILNPDQEGCVQCPQCLAGSVETTIYFKVTPDGDVIISDQLYDNFISCQTHPLQPV